MPTSLQRHLLREQGAFLRRDRRAWVEHLSQAKAFLGAALSDADPRRPTLILGAGWGLEVPWSQAPPGAVGWDADPFSRLGTLLRHRRWAPWVFEDMTGVFGALTALAERCVRQPWNGRRRDPDAAALRLAGLLPSLAAEAAPLRRWIEAHQPGLILSANLMGQFGAVAQALLRRAFAPVDPFEEDPDVQDPLGEALDLLVGRMVRAHLEALVGSGAELALVYDRAICFGGPQVSLGPWAEDWHDQIRSAHPLEVADPLGGVEPDSLLNGLRVQQQARWLWPVGPGQLHLVEARRLSRG